MKPAVLAPFAGIPFAGISFAVLAAALPAQVTFHREAGRQLVPADAAIERLGTGMKFVEGPVWLPTEQALVFSDIPNARLMRWTAKAGCVVWRDSEQSNGNALDLQGRLLSAQHRGRNVVRWGKDGKAEVLTAACDGKAYNSPNDLAVRADGTIWFTDPTYGLRGREQHAAGNFVYRLDPASGAVAIVHRGFSMPNGICFAPDHQRLYIADSGSKQRVGAFPIRPDGSLGKAAFWLEGGADGMRCDRLGNLYTTARDGVRIYSPKGERLATIALPEKPSNCAFGGADGRQLFVTARTSLYRVTLRVRGAGPAVGTGGSKAHNDARPSTGGGGSAGRTVRPTSEETAKTARPPAKQRK
ncbi:MAG: SMP-30/gluconolactonase/LRE family protein [Planctomycetota bacterium]